MTEYTLHHGGHDAFEKGHCLMEVVAHLAGEEHSDRPACACPALSAFGRRLNDLFNDDELRTMHLAKAAPLLVNSKDDSKQEERAFLLADLAVRRWVPVRLEGLGKKEEAQKLRELSPIVDRKSACKGRDVADRAADAARVAAVFADAAHAAFAAHASASALAAAFAATAFADAALAAAAAFADAAHAARVAASAAHAAAFAADAAAGCLEDAAACFIAILEGEDPWEIPLPKVEEEMGNN